MYEIATIGAVALFSFYAGFKIYSDKHALQLPEKKVAGVVSEVKFTETPLQKEPNHGLPVRLIIPKIKVDTKILSMGLTPTGEMEAPKSLSEVGWYKYGPHPGNAGNAVIAGHLGVGEPGIFIDLDKLVIGDEFSVADNKGVLTTFVVREMRTYNPDEHPKEVFEIDANTGAHLNLITCAGDWDKAQKTLSKRLVVFADKVIQQQD